MDILLLALDSINSDKAKAEKSARDPVVANTSHYDTRKSCHSCGNIRKTFHRCPICPHIFCRNCTKRMMAMYGKSVFSSKSCPVCANLCCCAHKSSDCSKKFHCYRKCPVSRADVPRSPQSLPAKLAGFDHSTRRFLSTCNYGPSAISMPTSSTQLLEGRRGTRDPNFLPNQQTCTEIMGHYQNLKLPGLLSCGLLLAKDFAPPVKP